MSRRSHEIRPRWFRQADADDVLHVERSVFGQTQGRRDQLLEWVAQPNHLAIVAEKHHRIVGFLLGVHHAEKQAFRIVNVAVHPHHRRQGAASLLLAYLLHHAERFTSRTLRAIVPERALDFQLFLKSRGFQAVRTQRGHFPESGQDAYLFTLQTPAEVEPLPF